MKLPENIKIKQEGSKFKVGLIVVNDQNEILTLNENLNRIDKQIYNIPTITINKFNEKEILDNFNEKYKFNINSLSGYINENYILDDECNKILQFNMWAKTNNYINDDKKNIWKSINELETEENILENIKEAIQIYKYNNVERGEI